MFCQLSPMKTRYCLSMRMETEVVTEMLIGMEDLAHVRLQHRQLNHHGGFVVSPDLYGMLGFCFSRPLLLQILGQSRLNVPLYRRWKPMTILRMVTIICINVIIWVVYRYLCVQDD